MTKETPAKVFSLLAAAMCSMFFLFAVTVTNAGFTGMETQMPDPFAPQKVMAVLDTASAGYSRFLAANLFEPAQADWALAYDNAKWAIDESADSVLTMTGLSDLASVDYYQSLDAAHAAPRIAGAYTTKEYKTGGFGINSLYSLLIR